VLHSDISRIERIKLTLSDSGARIRRLEVALTSAVGRRNSLTSENSNLALHNPGSAIVKISALQRNVEKLSREAVISRSRSFVEGRALTQSRTALRASSDQLRSVVAKGALIAATNKREGVQQEYYRHEVRVRKLQEEEEERMFGVRSRRE